MADVVAASTVVTTTSHVSLTTLFTAPPTCSEVITSSATLLWQGGMFQKGDVDCFPPSFSLIGGSAFSPGVCPHSWTVDFTLWATSAGETAAYCCPSGYRYVQTNDGQYNYCRSTLTGPVAVFSTNQLEFGPLPQNPALTTITPSAGTQTFVNQDLIQIRWQPSDSAILRLFAQESASAASAAAAAGKTTSTPTNPAQTSTGSGGNSNNTNSSSGNNNNSSGGLSGGIIAAIVVSIIAGIAIVGLSTWIIILMRRRKQRQAGPPASELPVSTAPGSGAAAAAFSPLPHKHTPSPGYTDPSSTYGPPSELDVGRSPVELPANHNPHAGVYSAHTTTGSPMHWQTNG